MRNKDLIIKEIEMMQDEFNICYGELSEKIVDIIINNKNYFKMKKVDRFDYLYEKLAKN